jgi:flagellar basal-body rod protein FlgF
MQRGDDGLFRMKNGEPATADASVSLVSGAVEASNVNVADAMVNMIELSRRFDLQVKAMHSAEENAQASSKLLTSS